MALQLSDRFLSTAVLILAAVWSFESTAVLVGPSALPPPGSRHCDAYIGSQTHRRSLRTLHQPWIFFTPTQSLHAWPDFVHAALLADPSCGGTQRRRLALHGMWRCPRARLACELPRANGSHRKDTHVPTGKTRDKTLHAFALKCLLEKLQTCLVAMSC